MMQLFFNGKSFVRLVEEITGPNTAFVLGRTGFNGATPDVTTEPIPGGKNLTISNNRWDDEEGTYQCFIQSGYGKAKDRIIAWLAETNGKYCRLEDTQDPDIYRLAKFKYPLSEKKVLFNDVARIDLTFQAAAQKYLVDGDAEIEITGTTTLENRTNQTALPLVTVEGTGAGEFRIGDISVSISDIGGGLTIDSELKRVEFTSKVTSSVTGEFPVLPPGESEVVFSGGVTGLKIVPRWWRL